MMLRLAVIVVWYTLVISEHVGREDWLDPNDMLNFDPATKTMRNKPKVKDPGVAEKERVVEPLPEETSSTIILPQQSQSPQQGVPEPASCPTKQKCKCEQAGLPLLRQYVKSILEHLHGQFPHGHSEDYNMYITLSPDHVHILQNFVMLGDQRHIHDVSEILTGMTNRVISSRLGRLEKAIEWMESKIGVSLHRLIQFLGVVSLASVIRIVEVKLQIPWRRKLWQLIILMFVISVPWTWYELLKQAEIKQQSFAMKDVPAECRNGSVDYWSTFKSYFLLQDDKCHSYYEHVLIDPMVKVPPTKAIAVTFVRFFLAPLKDVGTAVSEFLRALLLDLPLTLYPVAIAVVGLFSFMFLFMWFGYSIRLPFFLSIERSPQLSVADSKLNAALTENSQQIMKQLEELQNRIEASETNTADKLRHLEQVQNLAIEYSMSSVPGSPQPSPTIPVTETDTISPTITLMPSDTHINSPSDTHINSPTVEVVTNGGNDQVDSKPAVSSLYVSSEQVDMSSSKVICQVSDTNNQKQSNHIETHNVDTLMPHGVQNGH